MPKKMAQLLREAAAKSKAAAPEVRTPIESNLLTELRQAMAELSQLDSIERKAAYKKANFETFWPHAQAVIERDHKSEDVITRTMFVWAADAALLEPFLALAGFMFKHDIPLPPEFHDKKAIRFAAEAWCDHLEKKKVTATTGEAIFDLLDGRDIREETMAKFVRELGKRVEELGSKAALERAVNYYERALKLNPKVGAQTDLNRARKALEALSETKDKD